MRRVDNPFCEAYFHLHEQLRRAEEEHGKPQNLVLRFSAGTAPNPRRYNKPSRAEVAAVFTGDTPPSKREVSVYPRSDPGGGTIRKTGSLNGCLDPLTYPLLFPRGELGWCPDLQVSPEHAPRGRQGEKLGMCDFYTRRLMTHAHEPSMPHAGGRLFQQYIVDAYTRVEGSRLEWV